MHIFLRLFVFYKYILYICTVTNYKMMIDYRKHHSPVFLYEHRD